MVAQDVHVVRPSHHALAVTLYVFIATLLCFSVITDPAHTAIGHPSNDVWNHIWGFWWVDWCLRHGQLPLHTDLLGWPAGGSLWFIDILGAVTTLPVQWAAGPVAAYNASIWINFILCGVGGYALGLAVSDRWAGGVAAGVVYMTTPHLLGQAYNGISETLAAGWLPLAVLAMRRAEREPSARNGMIAGGLIGVTSLASWYYGLFAAIVLVGLLSRVVWRTRGRRRPDAAEVRTALTTAIAGSLVVVVVAAVPFALFARTMNAPDALVTRDEGFVWMTLVMHNMTDLISLFHPGKFYSPDLHAAFGEDLIVVVYLGMTAWIPGMFVLTTSMRRKAEPWVGLLLVFTVLSLGPYLYVSGQYVRVAGGWLPLPFLALFQWFPLFSRISHAYRFAIGAAMAVSVLVALAVRAAPRLGVRAGLAAVILAGLRIIETLTLSPAVWPLPTSSVIIPAVYRGIHDGAVLDLPITLAVLARSRVLVNQLTHHQPVPFGLNDPVPRYLHTNRYTNYILTLERMNISFMPPDLPQLDLVAGRMDLREKGCRWVVVHRNAYTKDQAARVLAFLDMTAQAVEDDGVVRVYDLDAALATQGGPETAH